MEVASGLASGLEIVAGVRFDRGCLPPPLRKAVVQAGKPLLVIAEAPAG